MATYYIGSEDMVLRDGERRPDGAVHAVDRQTDAAACGITPSHPFPDIPWSPITRDVNYTQLCHDCVDVAGEPGE